MDLPRASCPTCAGRIEEGQRVCHACGSLRPDAIASEEEERASLAELRQAMQSAMSQAELQKQPLAPVRDRFLRHAPVPRHTGALLDEAMLCQSFFEEALAADTTVPRERFKALLTRLDVNAVDEPDLLPKLDVLRARLREHEKVVARNDRNTTIGILVTLGLLVLLALLLLRGAAALFG
jgi:hypothetical protein